MTETTEQDWFDPAETTFGDRLAGAREAAGLSQDDLANRLGVRLTTVEDWENDVSEPRGNRLSMMSGVMNVSIRWLLTGAGEGPSEPHEDMSAAQIANDLRQVRAQMMSALERMSRLEDMLARQEEAPVD